MTISRLFSRAVRYGGHPDQVADLHLPSDASAAEPVPLVMLLHGGYWRAEADRAHVTVLAEDLAGRGLAVANVEYRRVGAGGGWPGTFQDVAAAADLLPDLVAEASGGRVDLDRIVYLGHSAGGQLALWTAVRHRMRPGAGADADVAGWSTPARLAGVVALAPAADLAWANDVGSGRGAVAELLGGGPQEFPDRYAAVDPAVLGAGDVPIVVVHGHCDESLPVEMARRYADSVGAELVALADADHFDLIDPESTAWPQIVNALQELTRP